MTKPLRRGEKMKTSVAFMILSIFFLPLVECAQSEYGTSSTAKILFILREVEARLRHAEKKIDLQAKDQGSQVAFGASLGLPGRHIGPYNTPITLAFKNVFINTGSYNPATGIFTAPVKGVYYFSFSGHGLSSKPMALRLVKNGKGITVAANHAAGHHYESTTNGMSLQLEVGDKVYLRLVPHTWVFDNSDNPTTFIGHLLFRL